MTGAEYFREEGFKQGIQQGKLEGKLEGKAEGDREAKLAVAQRLLDEGTELAFVAKMTGLAPKEVSILRVQSEENC